MKFYGVEAVCSRRSTTPLIYSAIRSMIAIGGSLSFLRFARREAAASTNRRLSSFVSSLHFALITRPCATLKAVSRLRLRSRFHFDVPLSQLRNIATIGFPLSPSTIEKDVVGNYVVEFRFETKTLDGDRPCILRLIARLTAVIYSVRHSATFNYLDIQSESSNRRIAIDPGWFVKLPLPLKSVIGMRGRLPVAEHVREICDRRGRTRCDAARRGNREMESIKYESRPDARSPASIFGLVPSPISAGLCRTPRSTRRPILALDSARLFFRFSVRTNAYTRSTKKIANQWIAC